jgi:hypothetical protein
MNSLEKIYYDLTGTPYLKVKLVAKNIVVKTESFKMSEKVITDFGVFKSPEFNNQIFEKNVYYVHYDITDFKPLKLVKKSVVDKLSELVYLGHIAVSFDKKDENYGKQLNNEPMSFITDKISPQEYASLLDNESLIAVSKAKKGEGLGSLFEPKNIVIVIILAVAVIFGYKYISTGVLF